MYPLTKSAPTLASTLSCAMPIAGTAIAKADRNVVFLKLFFHCFFTFLIHNSEFVISRYVFVFLVMACACYVIILQRILYWFVREKADDSPVSDLLPANLHFLYHL